MEKSEARAQDADDLRARGAAVMVEHQVELAVFGGQFLAARAERSVGVVERAAGGRTARSWTAAARPGDRRLSAVYGGSGR